MDDGCGFNYRVSRDPSDRLKSLRMFSEAGVGKVLALLEYLIRVYLERLIKLVFLFFFVRLDKYINCP